MTEFNLAQPNHVHSYPQVYAIGHSAIKDIFDGDVIVQEKVDGSQFSFGITRDGDLMCRSKGKQLILDAPEKMFTKAVAVVRELAPLLQPGWIYRGEYLSTPKHNTLSYNRTPHAHIILFDISTGVEEYADPDLVKDEAKNIGLEYAPLLYRGKVDDFQMFNSFMERESVLGGCKIEGIVVKNYSKFVLETKKVMMGKYVSEAFKEKHLVDWKERNPNRKDVVELLIQEYTSQARFHKAVQHLREDGKLEGSPRDIGLLIREVPADIVKEEAQEIKDKLFNFFWKDIERGITRGLPQWYKDELAKSSFEEN
jgi:hypothetical protein